MEFGEYNVAAQVGYQIPKIEKRRYKTVPERRGPQWADVRNHIAKTDTANGRNWRYNLWASDKYIFKTYN